MSDGFVAEFEELFGVAYRAAFVILGDRGDAEDCAQEALARAMVRWRRVGGYGRPWVARVATNLAIDRTRRRKRTVLRNEDGDRAEPGGDVFAAEREELVAALRNLPRRQREAVVLRHVADLSEAETADALGCSVGTVKSTVSRGLASLRVDLGAEWVLEA
ncbi:MAG: SigE family RNA polymerase sigma factor [Actinomycetota bacterium]|nr:SigE family RNA polymerase sigma factor [Actinomycetota bacterium]MDQ3312524.1 SigE family RNA polymerase sigma factor [Actinomycetota bacterium]